MHAQIFREYEQLKLTSEQVDALFENHLAWTHAEIRDDRKYLKSVYDVLGDEQDTRLDQILFQKWMNRGQLGPAIEAFAPDHGIERFDRKLNQLHRELKEIQRDSGLTRSGFHREDFSTRLAKLHSLRWLTQKEWLSKELGEKRVETLVGEPFFDMARMELGGRGRTSGLPANPLTGKLVKTFNKRPVDIPNGWTVVEAERELVERRNKVKQVIAKFETRIADAIVDVERARVAEAKKAAERARQARRGAPGMGRMGGMGGMMMGSMMGPRIPFALERKLSREADLEYQRAQFELRKLYRIMEELGGEPPTLRQEIRGRRGRPRLNVRSSWPLACDSPSFQSHLDATAEQCDQLDKLWDDYKTKVYARLEKNRIRWRREFERKLIAILNPLQLRRVQQLKFRQLWFSADAERAFAVTKIRLTDDDRTQIQTLVGKLSALHDKDRADRRRPFFLRRFYDLFEAPNRKWFALEQEFNDGLVRIVGDERAKVLLGQPLAFDQNWKRPVDTGETTIAEATKRVRELEKKVETLNKLNRELEAMVEAEFDLEDVNDERIEDLDQQISDLSSERQTLKKKLAIAKRVLEELASPIK